jgi:tetratricopeptide (TPR) repeat protein
MTPLTSERPGRTSEGSTAKLRRRLAGDVDDIVMMALRKEPDRRYASIEQFAEDVRNHLEGRPVVARKGSWNYRAGKFARRHKAGVAATAAVVLAIVIGMWTTVHEARIAASNQRRAEQRFNDVRKLANSLMFEIHDAIRDLPGSTPARRLLVTRAQEYLDSLSEQSKGDVSLQKELASAYERVGDVLGYPYAANLGDKAGALQNYKKALAIREALAAMAPNDIGLQRDLVNTYFRLSQLWEASGNFTEALAALYKAQPIAQRLSVDTKDPGLADYAAGGLYFTATIQSQTGDWPHALQNFQRSAEMRNEALRSYPQNVLLRTHLAADYAGVARCLVEEHDLSHAIEMQSKAAAILEALAKENPGNASVSEYLGEATNRLATYRREHGELAVALETYRRAHQIFGELRAADAKNSLAKSNFGFSDSGIGSTLVALHKSAEAVKVFRESINNFEEMSPRTGNNRYVRSGLADAYSGLGEAYSDLANGKKVTQTQKREYWELARTSCQKSLALWKDKEARGELDSEEHDSATKVARCVAAGEAQLAGAGQR